MKIRSRTAMIVLTSAITFIVVVFLSTAVCAASSVGFDSSAKIKFTPAAKQAENLKDTGLNSKDNGDGTISLLQTETSWNSLAGSTIEQQHNKLIELGILRYAIYDGTICQAVADKNSPMLIVILDFSDYSISKFEAGFLNGLAYAILGSNTSTTFNKGATFEVTNDLGGVLTVYNSTNGGAVKAAPVTLTLQGIYSSGAFENSKLDRKDGAAPQEIQQYSLRLILPRSTTHTVTMETGSMTMTGVTLDGWIGSLVGDTFSIVSPDCIALGISHLNIQPIVSESEIKWNEKVVIGAGVTVKPHFHWMTVTGHQMDYAFSRSLDDMLEQSTNGEVVTPQVGTVDEIFRKPKAYSDFSQLFLSVKKVSEKDIAISIYDTPNKSDVHVYTEEGLAAAVSMMHWLNNAYKLPLKKGDKNVTIYHYTRTKNNEIAGAGELSCDTPADSKTQINGEICSVVRRTLKEGNNTKVSVIGYFSDSGKLYYVSPESVIINGEEYNAVKQVNDYGDKKVDSVVGYFLDGELYDVSLNPIG